MPNIILPIKNNELTVDSIRKINDFITNRKKDRH